MTRYVDGLVGVGVQHLVEWYGMFYGREFIGGEIKVYCNVIACSLVCSNNCH